MEKRKVREVSLCEVTANLNGNYVHSQLQNNLKSPQRAFRSLS